MALGTLLRLENTGNLPLESRDLNKPTNWGFSPAEIYGMMEFDLPSLAVLGHAPKEEFGHPWMLLSSIVVRNPMGLELVMSLRDMLVLGSWAGVAAAVCDAAP